MANTSIKKVTNIYEKWSNPLRYLSTTEIERMLQNARYGSDEKLQLAFYEIERMSPIYSVCISKRISGITNRQWDVLPIDESEAAKNQAKRVSDVLRKCDMKNKDGFTEALRHLALAAFRGRSAVKPFINDNGDLILKKLQNWNFISLDGINYWNPTAQPIMVVDGKINVAGVEELPEGEVAYVTDDRPIDIPGLIVYLRLLIGEENWARAVEKYGIAQVLLKAPSGTPDSDLEKWNYRAQAIFEGASGILPNGTDVDILTEARAQDPFSSYIQHQYELISIMATGSVINTLGGTSGSSGTGMGSNVAEMQNSQFVSLVDQDCKKIANSITDVVVGKICRHFGQEQLCRFDFIESDDTSPKEYLELARAAKDLGLTIDVAKLKELTKLSFIDDEAKDLWTPTGKEN